MSTPLQNKTALITGSTSGIGLALAQGLATAGANIMLNGLGDKNAIETIRQSLESKGVKCLYNPADMTKPEDVKALVTQTEEQLQGIDILINSAGIQNVAPVDEFPDEKWDAIIAINLSSIFHTTKTALPFMKSRQWGRIINIASAHALVASPYKSAYVAAKHGVLGFTKTTALEVAEQGITVNAICPGYVKTPLVENQIADTAKARDISEDDVVKNILLAAQWTKKFVTTDQLSALTNFLCSDASASITGTALPIDGGWTAA